MLRDESLGKFGLVCALLRRSVATLLLLALPVALALPARALTLDDLRNARDLTPEGFVHRFAGFKFKLSDQVRPPEVFLSTRSGDCDDFATLAARVLAGRGYTTRLVAVYMERETHVVCYVKEAGAYLDYNNRNKAHPLVASDGTLGDIAAKVAASFGSRWTSALEYIFQNGQLRAVASEFPPAPASSHTASEG